MRFAPLVFLLIPAFLNGCANEGVVVQKDSGPQPFYHSLGVDGSYAFLLRDQSGATHRQLVTPDVFERYAVGDYFNDLQPGPAQSGSYDSKTVQTAMASPQTTTTALVRVAKPAKARHLAFAKKATHRKHLAQRKHARRTHARVARRKHARHSGARMARLKHSAPKPATKVSQAEHLQSVVRLADVRILSAISARCR